MKLQVNWLEVILKIIEAILAGLAGGATALGVLFLQ